MKLRLFAGVVLLAAVCAPEAFAFSFRQYGFVTLCMEADVAVLAKSLKRQGETFEIAVKEVVFGGPIRGTIEATFATRRGHEVPEFAGERLVFLSLKDGKYALVGFGTQSIWPEERSDGFRVYDYESARDVGLLVRLCKQLREFTSLAEAKRLGAINDMVGAKDPFLKLVGFKLCSWLLRRHHGEKYLPEVELGSAYAVAFVQSPWRADRPVFYAAVATSSAAPPSAGLRALLRGIGHPYIDQTMRNNAIIGLGHIAHRSGAPLPTLPNVEPVTLDGKLSVIKEWLSKAWPALVRGDAQKILAALGSDDPLRRIVGRMWLEACAGEDFGFNEAANPQERAVSVQKARAWLAEQSDPGK